MSGASPIASRLRAERGITLVEFLLAASAGLVVMGAAMMLLVATVNSELDSRERSDSIRDARTGLEQMTRELRQATSVTRTSDPSRINFTRLSGTSTINVLFVCSANSCRRSQTTAPAAAPTTATIPMVQNVEPAGAAPQPLAEALADDGCNSTLTTAPAAGVYDVFSVSPAAAGAIPRVCVRVRVEKGRRNSSRNRKESLIADAVTLRNAVPGS